MVNISSMQWKTNLENNLCSPPKRFERTAVDEAYSCFPCHGGAVHGQLPRYCQGGERKISSKKTGMDYNVTVLSLLWPYAFQMTSTKASHAKRFFGTPWRGEGYSYPVVVVDVQQRAHCLYNGHPSRHTLCMYS